MGRMKRPDLGILTSVLFLILIGILVVSSCSYVLGQLSKIGFDKRHLFLSFLSLLIIALLISIDIRKFFEKKYLILFYIFSLFLLIGLFFVPEIKETHRFYRLFGFLFQPSEFIKILLIIITAKILSEKEYPNLLIPLTLILTPPIVLINFQPDLGMTILIIGAIFLMFLYKGIPLKHILVLGLICIILITISVLYSPYQTKRISEFLEGKGEQQNAAVIALGSGGFWGKGIGKSHQKFFYLQMPHTDFAFSIIGEELGFVGSFFVLFFYGLIFYKGINLSLQMEREFDKYLVLGLTLLFTLNSLIHISVNLGFMPAKGITLPMVSYGGSSMFSNSILLGIILSLSMRKYEEV